MSLIAPTRRHLLRLGGAAALTPGLVGMARASTVARVLAVSDLHSAYDRTARLLAAFEAETRTHPVPHVIAINGDIFEHGNVVSVRSGGVIDWTFLAQLPRVAPTVVNLGNHDNDLTPDLADVVARMKDLGLQVVTTIADARSGLGYAAPVATLALGARSLRVVGIATNALNTYPKASRDRLSIPSASDWAKANLGQSLAGADLVMVMSHAGVAADRDILPLLPDGALMVGGHNHLLFQHRQGRSVYVHAGSWITAYTAATFHSDGSVTAESRPVALDAQPSAEMERLVVATLTANLTEEERTVLGDSPHALSLGDTGRRVAAGLARAAGADAGFIGHTTLGTGAPAGPVSRYIFDSIVRFDGKLMAATVSRSRFDAFSARANQDRPMPLADRNGDFLYASGAANGDQVRIATTDWCAANQREYFQTADLDFEEVAAPSIKTIAAAALFEGGQASRA